MVLATLYRSLLMRLVAAFIIVLVVSPYSEPFATMNGTDFGGAGAVDVGSGSKAKASTQDVLVTPLLTFVIVHAFAGTDRPSVASVVLDSRRAQRAILRL
jgi:hypothetical protein